MLWTRQITVGEPKTWATCMCFLSLLVVIVHSSHAVHTERRQPGAWALMEQINLLVLYAVLFLYQPNPHRVLNRTTTNTTPQEVLKLLAALHYNPPQHNTINAHLAVIGHDLTNQEIKQQLSNVDIRHDSDTSDTYVAWWRLRSREHTSEYLFTLNHTKLESSSSFHGTR